NDAVIHLFGGGHSHILTEEVFYRAGGLAAIHPILHEPLMLLEVAAASSVMERKNVSANTFMVEADIRPGDIMIVLSTS
ncbi:SIS domain-containing protein, partial [Listeria monocytogenes]|uniref:SIS domain-containing protein n=1 Tax=Listeria monocytogenes TaxID=1639 RepID=UPI001C8E86FB